ncbi:MAG: aspartate aminotransferase family protein [Planctomycetota bacterium]
MIPIPTLCDAPAVETRLGAGCNPPRDLTFVRGEGARLWDDQGRCYLDLAAGHGTAILGHAHPALLCALHAQAARLMSCPAGYANDQRALYLERLVEVLPPGMQRVFLCNSGTEAVEAALKVARLVTGRANVVACVRGFHGRTLGALSATWDRRHRQAFEPLLPGFSHIPLGKLDALREAVDEHTAAVILEVVQGEGGVRPAPVEFLAEAERVCRERGALLIVDEVQTGFGRTGTMFAVEHCGLRPDLLCLAKGIAGGFPSGALALGERVGSLPPGAHGSTFGGNPLACAAGLATLEVLRREGLVERAATLGAGFLERLRALSSPRVREVRGMGLMLAVELRERAGPYLELLLQRGVVALAAGPSVIRFLPPLVISDAELHEALEILEEVLA